MDIRATRDPRHDRIAVPIRNGGKWMRGFLRGASALYDPSYEMEIVDAVQRCGRVEAAWGGDAVVVGPTGFGAELGPSAGRDRQDRADTGHARELLRAEAKKRKEEEELAASRAEDARGQQERWERSRAAWGAAGAATLRSYEESPSAKAYREKVLAELLEGQRLALVEQSKRYASSDREREAHKRRVADIAKTYGIGAS